MLFDLSASRITDDVVVKKHFTSHTDIVRFKTLVNMKNRNWVIWVGNRKKEETASWCHATDPLANRRDSVLYPHHPRTGCYNRRVSRPNPKIKNHQTNPRGVVVLPKRWFTSIFAPLFCCSFIFKSTRRWQQQQQQAFVYCTTATTTTTTTTTILRVCCFIIKAAAFIITCIISTDLASWLLGGYFCSMLSRVLVLVDHRKLYASMLKCLLKIDVRRWRFCCCFEGRRVAKFIAARLLVVYCSQNKHEKNC